MFDIYHMHLLGWVDATIADKCELTLAKVDAVAQVIANVTPHVAHAIN